MYKSTNTIYKKIRKRLKGLNDFAGRTSGFKFKRISYSRPSTTAALKKFSTREIRVIEIGCAAGNNSLDILKNLNVKELVIIDPYEYLLNDYDDYTKSRLQLMRKQAEAKLLSYKDKITWINKLSADALNDLTGKYDFIYVDGDHSYEFAYQDMRNYLPFLADDYVFGGHDVMQQGVSKAICQIIKEENLNEVLFRDPDWILVSGQ